MTTEAGIKPGHNILGGEIPEIQWLHGDDLCDCTFQRIGEWTNPYIARTLRVRMCCIWAELYKQYPEFVQEIPAFYNYNEDRFETDPWAWDGETDMPRDIFHRQLAVMRNEPLEVVREKFEGIEPPKGVPKPKPEPSIQAMNIYELAGKQAERIAELESQLAQMASILQKVAESEAEQDE